MAKSSKGRWILIKQLIYVTGENLKMISFWDSREEEVCPSQSWIGVGGWGGGWGCYFFPVDPGENFPDLPPSNINRQIIKEYR